MRLPADDLALFFRLQKTLLFHVNTRLQIVPGIRDEAALEDANLDDLVRLRDALYDGPDPIDTFVATNPARLSQDELAIVAGWKQSVRGDFYIVRFLKRYAVFLTAEPPRRAYGVLGLAQEIEDVFPMLRPPIYLETVLLPFKGRIVYDGVARTLNVFFGPRIRGSLNEDYQGIRERGEIIESLETDARAASAGAASRRRGGKPRQSAEATLALLQRMAADAETLRGADTPATQRAFALVRAAIELATTAVANPADADEWTRTYRRARSALVQLHTSLSRTVWRRD